MKRLGELSGGSRNIYIHSQPLRSKLISLFGGVEEVVEVDTHKVIDAPRNVVFELLMDPHVLKETMPGLKTMSEKDSGIYSVEMELGIPGIKGQYHGELSIQNVVPPNSYHLSLEGEGSNGPFFMSLDVRLTSSNDAQTDLHYKGKGGFSDQSNSLGQKVLSGAGNLLISQFFGAISRRARRRL